ncbi:MAG TPA: hypothetical protein VE981_02500 [Planctomycetota bacterium]|nr:hypothetical protein [Planctomycetota bacterium]
MIRLAAILFPMLLSVSETTLYYRGPDNADPQDYARAAQAFGARCKSYGYKGIQTSVVDREGRKVVQVVCDTGITVDMKKTLNCFAELSGSAVELRFPLVLSDVEKEQFQAKPSACDDTAPAGARWFRFRKNEDPPVLLRDAPLVTRNEMQLRTTREKEKSGATRVYWEISTFQTREIREADKKAKFGTPVLVLDGWAVEAVPLITLEKNDEGKVVPAQKMAFSPTSAVVLEALANPMPFPLQAEETIAEGK